MLIDTDVLIDVALDRQPFSGPASEILERLERGERRAHIAWHTVSNFYYLVSPSHGAREFILELTHFVAIAPAGTEAIRYAASLPMRDFEDALQVAAARACGSNAIVTRNVKDYRGSPIPAFTPQNALNELF